MLFRRYLFWLTLLSCLTLLPAIILNLVLLKQENIQQMSFSASAWQEQTHGITFTPTLGHNGLFKTLRLNDRLSEIDTVILGASTAMTIDSTMMPSGWRLYNFTQSGSPLRISIAQADYLLEHAPQIKHYLIAMDWALDFIYDSTPISAVDLSKPDSTKIQATSKLSALATLKEAVSYPRMSRLWQVLRNVMHSPNPGKAFHEYFLQLGSPQYTCPDGKSLGKDFGIYNRGSCNGFRYDGSATFSDYNRAGNTARRLIVDAMTSHSKYAQALLHSQGTPNPVLLDRLAKLNDVLKSHGGQLILFMPPLIPGMEKAFLQNPELSPYLLHTKQVLHDWAQSNQIVLADFGQSEQFGCTSEEFLDPHHATQSCYQKIFSAFWQQNSAFPVTKKGH